MTQNKPNMSASKIMTSQKESGKQMLRVVLSIALAAGVLSAANKGPDAFGYTATDAAVFSYVDISGAGGGAAVLSGTDDGTAALTLPFSFTFYGTGYTVVCASPNGALYFVPNAGACNSVGADFANTDLSVAATPADLPAALPFWTDLTFQVPGAGAVFYQTIGTTPNRRFIVQWNNAYPSNSPNPVNFQAILTETANTVAFQYQTVDLGAGNVYNKGALSTVGIRATGAVGNGKEIPWSFDVPVLSNSYALIFTPPAPPPPGSGSNGGGGAGGASGNLTSPSTLTFNVPVNSVVTQPLVVTYTSTLAIAPVLQATPSTSDGGNWLTISPSDPAYMTLQSSSGGLYTYKSTLNVSVNGAGYGAGNTLSGTISFLGLGATAGTNVTVNLTAPAKFTAAPASLTYTYHIGDASTPTAQTLDISSTSTGASFSAAASTTTGGNWLSVSPANGTVPGTVSVSVNITGLAVGTYTGKVTIGSGASALDVPVTLNYLSANTVTITKNGIVPIYSTSTSIQAGSWISIFGTNLADSAVTWNGDFPQSLGGVSVTVDGKPAYLLYVSPTQINLQAPDDTASGTVTVVVTNSHGSTSSTVTLAPASPSFSLLDSSHVAGIVLTPDGSGAYGGGTYDIIGPVSAFSYSTRPVKAGETIELFGVGFGPTDPAVPAGQAFTGAASTVNPVTITIGGVQANVSFAGISSAGLYQFNLVVPDVPSGDQALQASVNGVTTGNGPVITIQ
jgi:uncharacterized protein (TIGR03437 family)